jgi:hypothetical protein
VPCSASVACLELGPRVTYACPSYDRWLEVASLGGQDTPAHVDKTTERTRRPMKEDTVIPQEPADESGPDPSPQAEQARTFRPDYAARAGLVLGYVRLVPQRNTANLVCRQCGQDLGSEVWAGALSDGRGGLYWTAPICYRCMAREGEDRMTGPERTRWLAALATKLAELKAKRQVKSELVADPEAKSRPRQRLSQRRQRPASQTAEPAGPEGQPPGSAEGTE